MGKSTTPSLTRLIEILRRQDPPKWGDQYEPAIKAVREEAPTVSRPAESWSTELGRNCHTLSGGELIVLFLVLHHPGLFEFQEQRALATEARPHPLTGHPLAVGMHLPTFKGTVSVAMRLGYLHLHPVVYMVEDDGAKVPVPFPWVGDFLLFMTDKDGPYCVNWTIKDDAEDFEKSMTKDRPVRDPFEDQVAEQARHAIEEIYYLDAGIRTVRVCSSTLPKRLTHNLRELFILQDLDVQIDADVKKTIVDRLHGCLLTGRPPIDAMLALRSQVTLSILDLKAVLYQAIWRRELRVDLFGDPLYIDLPLPREKVDVLRHFGHMFAREAA